MRALDFIIALVSFTVGYVAKQGTYTPIAIMLSLMTLQVVVIVAIERHAEAKRNALKSPNKELFNVKEK